jgi:cytochrome c oxidase cbb3-type subunit I/II
LELAGRNLYVREGCYNCHSQMIRTLKPDILRYGAGQGYSRLGESIYDRPFQWGSRRTGPDLAREGLLRPDLAWHYRHLANPRELEPDSIMPAYPWLKENQVDRSQLFGRISALRTLGVPYRADASTPAAIQNDYDAQAKEIVKALAEKGIQAGADSEMVALLAYLRWPRPQRRNPQRGGASLTCSAASSGRNSSATCRPPDCSSSASPWSSSWPAC